MTADLGGCGVAQGSNDKQARTIYAESGVDGHASCTGSESDYAVPSATGTKLDAGGFRMNPVPESQGSRNQPALCANTRVREQPKGHYPSLPQQTENAATVVPSGINGTPISKGKTRYRENRSSRTLSRVPLNGAGEQLMRQQAVTSPGEQRAQFDSVGVEGHAATLTQVRSCLSADRVRTFGANRGSRFRARPAVTHFHGSGLQAIR